MNKIDKKIDCEWLTKPTGDPFADVGALVIKYLWTQEQYKNLNILDLIKFVTTIYVNNWGAKLHAFFLNSSITQPAFSNKKKIEETFKYFDSIINETIKFKEGFCRISGKQSKLFYAGRDNHIMSGSGAFINFHHGYETGLYLSKEMLIRTFFVPFGLIQLSGKIALIHTDDEEVNYFFIANNVRENLRNIGINCSEGVLKSEYNNPSNAIFEFVDDCTTNIDFIKNDGNIDYNSQKGVTISLYLFTNFGASPDIEIYKIPSNLFKLISYFNKHFRTEWKNFVNHHYLISKKTKTKFDIETVNVESAKEISNTNSLKNRKNVIYEFLLKDKSIIEKIRLWSKSNIFNFRIVELYCRNILNMEQKTLQKIRDLADFIVQNPDASKIQKAINRLNGYKKSQELRLFVLGLIRDNYKIGNSKTLVTLEEYVEYLFPDGTYWNEIRNLLLIAIYQKLHELPDIKVEIEETDEEDLLNINFEDSK